MAARTAGATTTGSLATGSTRLGTLLGFHFALTNDDPHFAADGGAGLRHHWTDRYHVLDPSLEVVVGVVSAGRHTPVS